MRACPTQGCHELVARGYCSRCLARHRVATGRVVLVAGAPCSGKSTWVADQLTEGDLVVDYDAIAAAIGSTQSHDHAESLRPFICAARDALLDRLERPHSIQTVYVIRCDPEPMLPGAKLHVMPTSREECHRRADDAGRPASWHHLINRWFLQWAAREAQR